MKNRINTLLEVNIHKKRITTVKKSLTTVSLEPYRENGFKFYKVSDRDTRNADWWESKIAIDQTLQPSNKAYKTVGLLGLKKTYIKREV